MRSFINDRAVWVDATDAFDAACYGGEEDETANGGEDDAEDREDDRRSQPARSDGEGDAAGDEEDQEEDDAGLDAGVLAYCVGESLGFVEWGGWHGSVEVIIGSPAGS